MAELEATIAMHPARRLDCIAAMLADDDENSDALAALAAAAALMRARVIGEQSLPTTG